MSKINIYQMVLRPKRNWLKVHAWEINMFRRLFRGEQCWVWSISIFIVSRRLEWLGYLVRMNEEKNVKNIACKDLDGKKKRGRPRER